MFRNGERQVLVIDDGPTVADDPAATAVGAPKPRFAEALEAIPDLKEEARQQPIGTGGSVMPGSTRAFLGDGTRVFNDSEWTSTKLVKKMLESRGYVPEVRQLELGDFTHLSDYGVILLETHGGWGGPKSVLQAIEFPKELGIKEDPSIACGGRAGQFHIVTTTPFTQEAIDKFWGEGREGLHKYATDIVRQRAGKGARISRTIRGPDGRLRRVKTFWVSAHFIRAHDQGTFPDNTLLFLNACVGYDGDLAPLKDVLFEKTKRGAYFLGWDDETLLGIAVRASLNLFQIMTHSNESDEKTVSGKPALEKASPPRGGVFTELYAALGQLTLKGFDRYEEAGHVIGRLRLEVQPGGGALILMPYLLGYISNAQLNHADFIAFMAEGEPEVRIGGAKVTLQNWTSIQSRDASAPVGAYGDIVLEEKGRKSPPVPMHRWKMQIRISRNVKVGAGMSYDVTFTLHGRGVVMDSGFRDSVWENAPPPVIKASWDPEASFISWNISGEESDERYKYEYDGSGGPIKLLTGQAGGLGSNQAGNEVTVSASGDVTYTVKTTDLDTNEVTVRTVTEAVGVDRTVMLISDWSILDENYTTTDFGLHGTATVRWSEVPAEPPFDPDEAAR
jgi:hypothetical protein